MCTDKQNKLRCVDRISLFDKLTYQEKETLFSSALSHSFNQGELIDQLPVGIYIVKEGNIAQVNYQLSGQMHVIDYWHKGDILGEDYLLRNEPLSFVAETNGELCIIPQPCIQNLLRDNADLSLRLLGEATVKVKKLESRLYTLSIKEVSRRVAQALLDLQVDERIVYSHQKIADYCYVSRETVTRKLAYLAENKWITVHRTYIQLLDESGLKNYIDS